MTKVLVRRNMDFKDPYAQQVWKRACLENRLEESTPIRGEVFREGGSLKIDLTASGLFRSTYKTRFDKRWIVLETTPVDLDKWV